MPASVESSRPILSSVGACPAAEALLEPPSLTRIQAPPTVRNSARMSTYSNSPSLTPSLAPSDSSVPDPRTADIRTWNAGFDRLDDKRLASQRYVPSLAKTESLSKLALGAKLERALGRRMSSQDAVFTRRRPAAKTAGTASAPVVPILSEKVGREEAARA